MQLSATHTIDAPIQVAYDKLNDPAVLQRCIPGCEKMERTADDHYAARLQVGLAAIKGGFTAQVRVAEKRPPHAYTLHVNGNGPLGFVRGTVRIELRAAGEKTELSYAADVQVGGMIAAVGSRIVDAAAKSQAREFFNRFGQAAGGHQS